MARRKKIRSKKVDYKKWTYPRLVPPTFDFDDVNVKKVKSVKKRRERRNKAKDKAYISFKQQVEYQRANGKKAKRKSASGQRGSITRVLTNQGSVKLFSIKYNRRILKYLESKGLVYTGNMDVGESLYNFVLDTTYQRPNRDPSHNKQYYAKLLLDDNYGEEIFSDLLRGDSLEDMVDYWIDFYSDGYNPIIRSVEDVEAEKEQSNAYIQAEIDRLQSLLR